MSCYKCFLIFFVFFSSLYVNAQENDDEGVYKKIYILQEEMEKKNKEIETLRSDTAKLRNEILGFKRNFPIRNASVDTQRVNELESVVLKRDSLILRLNDEVLRLKEKNKADSLTMMVRNDGMRVDDKGEVERLTRKVKELQDELAGLEVFKVKWLRELVASVDEKWMSKAYSEIDSAALEKACAECARYKTSNEDTNRAYEKLSSLLRVYKVYKVGFNALCSKYDMKAVARAYFDVLSIKGKVPVERRNEIEAMLRQLDDYKYIVRVSQNVVRAVEKNIVDYGAVAKPMIEVTLKNLEKKDESISVIKSNPWLCKQYEMYHKSVMKDCMLPNEIGEMIKSIKTE